MIKTHAWKNALVALAAVLVGGELDAYPLNGEAESGIRRLEGYQLAQQQQQPSSTKLSPGALWGVESIHLHLLDYSGPDFDQLEQDPQLQAALSAMLSRRDPSYSMVLVDFTDEGHIRWAGLRPDLKQNPGSVGKLLCMAGLFNALAEAFPDPDDRQRVLITSVSRAGSWVNDEIHVVPKWDPQAQINRFSVINTDDEFRLSEWLDHAISASANGAGAIIWREAMLIKHFGSTYPQSVEISERFFKETPKSELSALAREVITAPLLAARIDISNLQQGSFFTGNAKRKVPGGMSFATSRELARLLFRMEQGRLVDEWSSLQMKKYMYMTKRRYRYVYAPELSRSAVFFKSGSLYSCIAEEGFRCGKYMGNKKNLMNSVTIVEGPQDTDPRYIVALMSDVKKVNSAWDHSRIGAATDEMVRSRQPQQLKEQASDKEISEAGKS
jgi:hypothetical protein